MIAVLIIILVVVAGVGLCAWYAAIVKRKNQVSRALANIDAQLTLRHELVPKVLEVAKHHLADEQDLIFNTAQFCAIGQERIGATAPRDLLEKFRAEIYLSLGLGRLFALSQNCPELKDETLIARARTACQKVETNVAPARRFYNTAVSNLRNACQHFPGRLLAQLAGLPGMPPFYQEPPDSRVQ